MSMEPPKTAKEQAELEQAIADMLECREPPLPRIEVHELFGPVERGPLPDAVPVETPSP